MPTAVPARSLLAIHFVFVLEAVHEIVWTPCAPDPAVTRTVMRINQFSIVASLSSIHPHRI